MKKLVFAVMLTILSWPNLLAQNIGISTTGSTPDAKAMLDIVSSTSGLLIPRMNKVQRDAITSAPNGLLVLNTTSNTLDIYRSNHWESVSFSAPGTNLVYVYSLSDLPAPSGGGITLDATKMYVFSGIVNISANYINLNGAGMRGTDPAKDGVMSTVSGGILRSTGVSVFIENLAVLPASAGTKAYDLADATGLMFCNIFSGCSVVEIGIPSLGVGQISGFKAITINKNYWNCKDGIKITGAVGKFASSLNFITGITAGSGIEFLSGLTINDIDLSNNYFIYTGQTGVKVDVGATIDRGRMTSNMYRGVTTCLSGFDSYTPAWEMSQNTNIPNTRAYGSLNMNNNTTSTSLPGVGTFYKIAGTSTIGKEQRFTITDNRLRYDGIDPITAKILIITGAKSPQQNCDFTIAIAKNGSIISTPFGSMAPTIKLQSFQLSFATEVDIVHNDYLEVWIRTNNGNTNTLQVDEMQFRITD